MHSGATAARARHLERRDIPLTGHQDRALHSHALRTPNFWTPEVGSERAVAGRLGPDEHAVRIAFVLGDVGFHPLDHGRNVFRGIVPILAGVALHDHGDHAVLGGPAADVVHEGVGFPVLLLDFVSSTAGNVHQDGAVLAAFIAAEYVHHVFRIGTEGDVARDVDRRDRAASRCC